ncbi:MAG: lipoyl synthase [Chloroflexi bacterium]|nr:lipoyl synthase [Chloroflexota bacterium]
MSSEPIDFHSRRPQWLKVPAPLSENYGQIKSLMRGLSLHTVCEEARCPNIGDCWGRGTATFLILGDTCTRSCGFCNIKTGRPQLLDLMEPERVARAVERMQLKHVVITSVNRDELPDGGAQIFSRTISRIRELVPGCSIEVLIPDFRGSAEALKMVMDQRPEILNHNVETVPRLYRLVRPQALYQQSMELLQAAKGFDGEVLTKSGIMLGLGESLDEVRQVMRDWRAHDVDIITIGQYLRPSEQHLPVMRYVPPDEFEMLKSAGYAMGFKWVESGPLVRSSYHAEQQVQELSRVYRQLHADSRCRSSMTDIPDSAG